MKLFVFFLMLPHLNPTSIEIVWPVLDRILNILRVVSVLIIAFLYIAKKRIPSKPIWVIVVLWLWIFISTYINKADIMFCIKTAFSILAITMIVDFWSAFPRTLIAGLLLCFEFALYANLISIILYYPEGMYISGAYYFLGNRNGFILYVLPAMLIAFLYAEMTGKKLRPLATTIVGTISIIITWSATAVCALMTFIGIMLLAKTNARKYITFFNVFAATMILNVLISVFRIMDQVMWMANFIESFLQKRITLTGRTMIWDRVYELFLKSPWIGYGVGVHIVGSNLNGGLATHAHNFWLQCLMEGGIIALVLFLILNFVVGKDIEKCKNEDNKIFLLAVFGALYIMFITESQSIKIFYILFLIATHMDKFEKCHLTRSPLFYKKNHIKQIQ